VKKYLDIFLYYKCKVTLVFDGHALPAKQEVNDSRKARRESNQSLGAELIAAGKNAEAYKVLRQGIGVPKEITEATIKVG
jgi:5'-3' exonuclease